jgi:DNA repair exonuclease SbcCD nuclease subunit
MKIGIVGDLHIAPIPDKRIDDYFQAGLGKIEQISKYCDVIIFLGDIFTSARVDERFVYSLIQHLNFCKNMYNVKFYTIVGNHDVVHEDENNLQDSSLGILQISGAMDIILDKPLLIGDYSFSTIPVNFKRAKDVLPSKKVISNLTEVLLVHHEYETGTNCFSYEDFRQLNCQWIFLGHDHKPFDEGRIVYPEFTIYRSGSIMRNRADDYNFTRPLYYYVIENGVVSCVGINAVPFNKVFKVEAINKIELQEKKYTESIDKIIQKYENNISVQDKFSIKLILQELKAKPEIIDYIRKKYDLLGEVFV